MRDFFISYTSKDHAWAEWIAETIENAGFTTIIQSWDFLPGDNFLLKMHEATTETRRTIVVLSKEYLHSLFTQPEWAAALARDPTSASRALVPVRVEPCNLTGLLRSIVYIDLVDTSEELAAERLLLGLKEPIRAASLRPEFNRSNSLPKTPTLIAKHQDRSSIQYGIEFLDTIPGIIKQNLNSKYSFCVFDVDGMSGINRKYGENIGNAVLAQLVLTAEKYFKRSSVVSRCGDDTFFIFTKGTLMASEPRLKRLMAEVNSANWGAKISAGLLVSLSASLTEFSAWESTANTVLRAAMGCSNAQREGRGLLATAPAFIAPRIEALFATSQSRISDGIRWCHS